jgi:methanogenic corrinoid protein MtbC1
VEVFLTHFISAADAMNAAVSLLEKDILVAKPQTSFPRW